MAAGRGKKRPVRRQGLEDLCRVVASGFGPGGGTTASAAGALAAVTAAKAARLSALKKPAFEKEGKALEALAGELLDLAQADDEAYAGYLRARKMPQDTAARKARRAKALAAAVRTALEVPLRGAEVAALVVKVSRRLAKRAPVAAVDAEIAELMAAACVRGNVLLANENLGYLKEKAAGAAARRRIGAVERVLRG